MHTSFTGADWAVLFGYVALLSVAGWLTTRRGMDAEDYFLAGHHAPTWLVAISVLSTVQSAATFLGVPDNSYRGNYTYIGGVFSALIAAWIAGNFLIPRFYALQVTTVYELLEARFNATARRAAGMMYLIGRILASGARLYLAAIAVSMILFLDISPMHIMMAAFILLVFGLVFTFMGGLESIIWSDLLQVILYVGAALVVAVTLWESLPMSTSDAISELINASSGNKLVPVDPSLSLSAPFGLFAVLTGVMLLNLASSGLDQDITQRLLACEDAAKGRSALYASVLVSLPVILLFLAIGSLLWLHYQGSAATSFNDEKVTVFMRYILTEVPPGLRGLVTVGVIAAAAINSGLISMANVLVNDLYRPFAGQKCEAHFVRAGRVASVVLGLALFGMAVLSYYWQRYSDAALLDFVLSVMAFAYSGLLGVYAIALFTNRGNSTSVIAAFAAGFLTVLCFQAYIVDMLGLPVALKAVAFPWHLCLGTAVAALVCALGEPKAAIVEEFG